MCKPTKPQKFSSNKRHMMDEVYLVAEECGLIREGEEYEEKNSDRYPYWIDTDSGRRFRLIEESARLDVSEDPKTFDRWGNSTLTTVDMPNTLERFAQVIQELRYYTPNKNETVSKKSRKSKDKQ